MSTYLKALRDIHQKLFDDDLIHNPALERMICCHILEKDDIHEKISMESENSAEVLKKSKRQLKKEHLKKTAPRARINSSEYIQVKKK